MKLLVIIAGYHDKICYDYIDAVNSTWSQYCNENIQFVTSYGNSQQNILIDNVIHVNKKDLGLNNTYEKALDVLEVAYHNIDFDIVLRTSLSTYFRLDLLYNVLKTYDAKDFFGSTYDHPLDSGCFAGSTMLLSKDVIKKLLDIRYIDNPSSTWDDTGIEYLLRKIYPNYTDIYKNFKRLDIMENSLVRLEDPLFFINNANIWAFRCKTSQNGVVNRELDIKKMNILHNIFYKR